MWAVGMASLQVAKVAPWATFDGLMREAVGTIHLSQEMHSGEGTEGYSSIISLHFCSASSLTISSCFLVNS
jgi:hypothetical protein